MNFDNILRNVIIVGLFMILFIPFVVANDMFFPFITGKNFAFRIITEVIFGSWALLALRNVAYRPNFSWILIALTAFVGIIALADAFGANPMKSFWSNFERMEGLVTLVHLLMYVVVAATVLKTEKMWTYFLHTTIGVSLFAVMFGFFQIDGLTQINQGGVRVDAKFGNATYLAVYMLFHIFLTGMYLLRGMKSIRPLVVTGLVGFIVFLLAIITQFPNGLPEGSTMYVWISVLGMGGLLYLLFQEGKEWVYKYVIPVLYGALLVSQLAILYFTATRGSILGVLGGILLTGLLIALFERERVYVRRAGIGLLVAVVVLVGTFFVMKDADFIKSSPVLSRFSGISAESGTVQSRFTIWSMAYEGVKERPILGWGQENFNLVFNKYYDPVLYHDEPWFDRTHNIFFDWLIAGGILGLLAYLSIPLALMYYIWFGRGGKLTTVDKSVLTGLLAAYMFHNMFVFDNLMSYIMYGTILAYVYAMTTEDVKEGMMATKFSELVVGIASSIIIIVTVFTVYAVNTKPILASTTLIDALRGQQNPQDNITYFKEALAYNTFANQEIREQLVQAATRAARADVEPGIRQEIFELARSEMEKQRAIAPDDARHALFSGTLLDTFGQTEAAQEHFEDAQRLSPNKQTIRFALAGNLMNLSRHEEARELLEETIALAPDFNDAHIMYAISAIYAGDLARADAILIEQFGETAIDNARLMQAYVNTGNWERVKEGWELRVEKNPNNTQSRLSLAASYLQLKQPENAIREIEKAMETDLEFKQQGEFLIQEIRAGRTP